MDPDEARIRMVELANATLAMAESEPYSESWLISLAVKATELAEAVHALDEWLRSGGFLPDVWTHVGLENFNRKQDV